MPELSLTDFVDIVSLAGVPRMTKIAEVKNRSEYHPATDFYRPLRNVIISVHRDRTAPAALHRLLQTLTDKNKQKVYPALVEGYLRWYGRKRIEWFDPPREVFTARGLDVKVNPELGLLWAEDRPHVIKLYFKKEPLAKLKVDVILHLMAATLLDTAPPGSTMAILDLARSRLITPTVARPKLGVLLDGELAAISAMCAAVHPDGTTGLSGRRDRGSVSRPGA